MDAAVALNMPTHWMPLPDPPTGPRSAPPDRDQIDAVILKWRNEANLIDMQGTFAGCCILNFANELAAVRAALSALKPDAVEELRWLAETHGPWHDDDCPCDDTCDCSARRHHDAINSILSAAAALSAQLQIGMADPSRSLSGLSDGNITTLSALSGPRRPESALDTIANDARLRADGWDSYGSCGVTDAALDATRRFLAYRWAVMPTSDGGIQLERHDSGFDIEINFNADGQPREPYAVLAGKEQKTREAELATLAGRPVALPATAWDLLKRINSCDLGPDDAQSNLIRELYAALLAQEQIKREAETARDEFKAAALKAVDVAIALTDRLDAAEQATRKAEIARAGWSKVAVDVGKRLHEAEQATRALQHKLDVLENRPRDEAIAQVEVWITRYHQEKAARKVMERERDAARGQAATDESYACEELAAAHEATRRAEQERFNAEALIEATRLKLVALQDSVDGCAKRVHELLKRAEAAESQLQGFWTLVDEFRRLRNWQAVDLLTSKFPPRATGEPAPPEPETPE